MKTYPSVLDQGFAGKFLPHDPQVRNYNSGMLRRREETFYATRFLNPRTHRSDIAITRTSQDFQRQELVHILPLPRHALEHFEDGRLFEHQGRTYVSYVEGHYYTMPFNWVQKLALLDDKWDVLKIWTIPYAGNSVTPEKNWGFFSHAGDLCFVHQIAEPDADGKNHVVVTLDVHMDPVHVEKRRHHIDWPHGTMSGGTPPVMTATGYVSFFHSYIKEKPHERRYCMAAYRFDPGSFAITGYTDPLIWASEADPVLPNHLYTNWLPLVIFPCGAIHLEALKSWIVSAGVNDSKDVLLHIPDEELHFHDL